MEQFDYVAATSIDEAVALLAEKQGARPLAGGTDLLVQVRSDRRHVERVVDVKAIPETNELSFNPERGLTIGAAVPCYRVYDYSEALRRYPALVDSSAMIGSIQIQSRASIGGNLCNGAPSADCIPSLIVLGATCLVAGPSGTRRVNVSDFCVAPGQTVLQDGELLVHITIPTPPPRSGSHYLRFIPRNEMDIAVAGVGAAVTLSDDGQTIKSAVIALASVAPTPLLASEAGAVLTGRAINDDALTEAAEKAALASRPISDMRGTAQQRRHLVNVLTRRALQKAIARARNGGQHA